MFPNGGKNQWGASRLEASGLQTPGVFWASTPSCFPDTSRKTYPAGGVCRRINPTSSPKTSPDHPSPHTVRRCQVNIRIANNCRCHLNFNQKKSVRNGVFVHYFDMIWGTQTSRIFHPLRTLQKYPKIWPCHLWLKKNNSKSPQISIIFPCCVTFFYVQLSDKKPCHLSHQA